MHSLLHKSALGVNTPPERCDNVSVTLYTGEEAVYNPPPSPDASSLGAPFLSASVLKPRGQRSDGAAVSTSKYDHFQPAARHRAT